MYIPHYIRPSFGPQFINELTGLHFYNDTQKPTFILSLGSPRQNPETWRMLQAHRAGIVVIWSGVDASPARDPSALEVLSLLAEGACCGVVVSVRPDWLRLEKAFPYVLC
jgi:hypothetical protein